MTTRRRVDVGGAQLDVIDAGERGAPVVVLSHGFPECAHSWRHQINVLADAGYHVLAPDQRGYGRSSAPGDVEAYGTDSLSADLLGLLDDAGADDAVFVGHDWGALLVWDLARFHPRRVRAVVAASVPFVRWPMAPTELMRSQYGDRFFYILYFQAVGQAEAELEADVERTLRTVLWAASGGGVGAARSAKLPPMEGTGLLDSLELAGPIPAELPPWLTADDLAVYVDRFEASGFFGPLSWYRNLDRDHELTKDLPPGRISMPTCFIGGTRDVVITSHPGSVEAMARMLPNLVSTVLIDGAGHWTQQEAPGEFNAALLDFLRQLDGP